MISSKNTSILVKIISISFGLIAIVTANNTLGYRNQIDILRDIEARQGSSEAIKQAEYCSGPKDELLYRITGGMFDYGKWTACEDYLYKHQ
ncbi:hypothetical protein J4230_05690 [Candidatus Woesearchaeota archaeon]|nr:hypothetical protein [Candidatus Woesearchaeota archaeon]